MQRVRNLKLGRSLATLASGAMALAWTVAAWAEPLGEPGVGLPRDVSTEGHRIDWLMHYSIFGMVVCFIIMCVWMFWACFKHTEKAGHEVEYTHGNSKRVKAIGLAFAFGIFLTVDGMLFYNSSVDMHDVFQNFEEPLKHPDVVRVEVNAHQWAWDFRYPGPDGKFNTKDDVITLNELKIPVGVPVVFQIGAVDVIHAFYLPNFRYKVDAVPGTVNGMWIQATETGEYAIGCAQHCGTNHYKMKGQITVMPKGDFDQWYARASGIAATAYDPDDLEAHWGWDWKEM